MVDAAKAAGAEIVKHQTHICSGELATLLMLTRVFHHHPLRYLG